MRTRASAYQPEYESPGNTSSNSKEHHEIKRSSLVFYFILILIGLYIFTIILLHPDCPISTSISESTLSTSNNNQLQHQLNLISNENIQLKSQINQFHSTFNTTTQSNTNESSSHQKYFMVLDLWERLYNFRHAFHNLLYISHLYSNTALIVPFVYETKVSIYKSFPEHFTFQNLSIQSLEKYFNLDQLFMKNQLISYSKWITKSCIFIQNSNQWKVANYISVLLIFIWNSDELDVLKQGSTSKHYHQFWWCDQTEHLNHISQYFPTSNTTSIDFRTREMRFSANKSNSHGEYYFEFTENVIVERILCVDGVYAASGDVNRYYFEHLMEFIEDGVDKQVMNLHGDVIPLTIALRNYRKSGYSTFLKRLRYESHGQFDNALMLSNEILELAERTIALKFGDPHARYIGIHFRVGRMMQTVQKSDPQGDYIVHWAMTCITKLKTVALSLETHGKYVIATDLSNDGMRGGEYPMNGKIRARIQSVKEHLMDEFEGAVTFDAESVGLDESHDKMGLSSLADLALCAKATHFVSMKDSFAKMVRDERNLRTLKSHIELCPFSIQDAIQFNSK